MSGVVLSFQIKPISHSLLVVATPGLGLVSPLVCVGRGVQPGVHDVLGVPHGAHVGQRVQAVTVGIVSPRHLDYSETGMWSKTSNKHLKHFWLRQELKKSLCVSVRLSVCAAQTCLEQSIFIF